MQVLRRALGCALAIALLLGVAASAGAQGVTGTITGTVKDAQGGVIPGATVTLISDTRGTTSAPAISNASGDFVFPNVTADTYTVQIEMPSFRTLRRSGVSVSPGSIVALGSITIEVGGTAEVLTVKAETPLVQTASGERSFTVSTESVSNLPLANRTFDSLLSLERGGRSGTEALGRLTAPVAVVETDGEWEQVDSLKVLVESFADAVEGRAPFPVSTGQMLDLIAAFEAIITSLETRAPAPING